MLAKSSTPVDCANLEPTIVRLERQAVDELHQAGDGFAAAQMCDVDPLDRPRRVFQLEHFLQAGHPLLRIDEEDFGLDVRFQFAALVERFQHLDFVAQAGRQLELQRRGRLAHLGLHFVEQRVFLALQKHPQAMDVAAIIFLRNPQIARSRTLVDRGQQAWPKPAPFLFRLANVEAAGAELENLLQHLNRPAQTARAGKRTVKLRAPLVRLARELDARKLLAHEDLQIRKRLVVLLVLIELRLHVLDQPGFGQQRVDLALGRDEIDVARSP